MLLLTTCGLHTPSFRSQKQPSFHSQDQPSGQVPHVSLLQIQSPGHK